MQSSSFFVEEPNPENSANPETKTSSQQVNRNDEFLAELENELKQSDEQDLANSWWWFWALAVFLFVLFVVIVVVLFVRMKS